MHWKNCAIAHHPLPANPDGGFTRRNSLVVWFSQGYRVPCVEVYADLLLNVEFVFRPVQVNMDLRCAITDKLNQPSVHLGGNIFPRTFHFHLPESASTTRGWHLHFCRHHCGLVLPSVNDCELRVHLSFIEEYELTVGFGDGLAIPTHAVETLCPSMRGMITRSVHNIGAPNEATAHKECIQRGVPH